MAWIPAHKRLYQQLHRRDRGICGVCGDPINPSLSGNHPQGGTIDHRKPRSAGGTDDPDNLQPAHRRCNEVKSDRIPWYLV